MSHVFQAEVFKFLRRRVLLITAAVVTAAAVAMSILVFSIAESAASDGFVQRLPTIEALSAAGGGTAPFAAAVSFLGGATMVVFAASWASEFSQGTFRTLLLQEPQRLSVLGGKLAGMLVYVAGALAAGMAISWLTSFAIAPLADVSTAAWWSWSALVEHGRAYLNALIGLSAWATYGMMLGVVIRSTPLAAGIGLIWVGPFEHLTEEAWSAVSGFYPGLLLESLAVGGTDDASYVRTLVLTGAYVVLAAAAVLVCARRDVVR